MSIPAPRAPPGQSRVAPVYSRPLNFFPLLSAQFFWGATSWSHPSPLAWTCSYCLVVSSTCATTRSRKTGSFMEDFRITGAFTFKTSASFEERHGAIVN